MLTLKKKESNTGITCSRKTHIQAILYKPIQFYQADRLEIILNKIK